MFLDVCREAALSSTRHAICKNVVTPDVVSNCLIVKCRLKEHGPRELLNKATG